MKWPGPLQEGVLVKRYKRFLADFHDREGQPQTAHCANTGSMKTCWQADAPIWISHHPDPKRKLKYTLQAVQMDDGWVGVNTGIANALVAEAIETGVIEELAGYDHIKREQKYGDNSRIDLLLTHADKPDCYVEVKNVTLLVGSGEMAFPDAVTKRGTKHLQELAQVVASGKRAVLLFCVQRQSATTVRAAHEYDPEYAKTLAEVVAAGVEVYAYRADLAMDQVRLTCKLSVTT
jgi:sugar fermentation stimulation protein A